MAYLIFNPRAGRQRPLLRAQIERAQVKLSATLAITEGPGQATQLARDAARSGFSPIIAAGGDGTVNEIVNGMMEAGRDIALGIIPVGTGNDLAFQMKIPGDVEEAARVIAASRTRRIDVLCAGERSFVNCSGLAVEAHISTIQTRLNRRLGRFRYFWATLIGVMNPPNWTVRLQWREGVYKGPVTLLSVGNCPRTGGMFYSVPHANPEDGQLSFVYAHLQQRRRIARALPMTFRSGRGSIAEHPAVREVHTTWLKVQSNPPMPVHVDGELLPARICEIEYKIRPGALRVLVP